MWLVWIANAVLLVLVAPLIVLWGNRVLRPACEISRYADDILEHGVCLAANVAPVPALIDTAALVAVAKGHAVRYVTALDPLV